MAKYLVPELPWAAAIALGAIVAPPDAVAAGAVLSRLRLPRRLVTVLEGEPGERCPALVLYRFAVAAVGAGALAPWDGMGRFLLLAAGGVAMGWVVGRPAIWVQARLGTRCWRRRWASSPAMQATWRRWRCIFRA
ncbi:cation:proton antiporter [Siccirubricoccus sp. G192]|uniref:cation:proton antiporter domain-containing protein n=1 Tax=Siccirubricoccus sp. G192 TaxID=2849651 RepID=UPI001C2BDBE5|nr:cation:proton antiporter [Siccirubricoccus sp. G192]MBV1795571.1 cation:proton antiporter [Siccirubricoccus sp. G192]